MLKKIRLTDFKSFVDEEVELAPLNLLVGANASGKSNFLDAIRFLHGLSRNLTLSEILNGEERTGSDRWQGIRGRAEEVARISTASFTVESSWLVPGLVLGEDKILRSAPDRQEVWHRLSCWSRPRASIQKEQLKWAAGNLRLSASPYQPGPYRAGPHQPDQLRVQTSDRRSRIFSDTKSLVSDPVTRLTLSNAELRRGPEVDDFEILEGLLEALSAIRFLDIQPSQMRGYGRRNAPLGNEGKNLSGVLASLCDDPEIRYSLTTWLREVCAPELEDIDFAEVQELGDVMAIFVEKNGTRVSARSISDGTLRFLGTLLALRTAHPGEIILIEDLEEGLHPTRIHLLLEVLESVARRRQLQVFATTHSPVVLQWLTPERLREVIVFGRVSDHKGTIIRRLGDLPHFDEVVQRTGIEELFTTGWLEMAL